MNCACFWWTYQSMLCIAKCSSETMFFVLLSHVLWPSFDSMVVVIYFWQICVPIQDVLITALPWYTMACLISHSRIILVGLLFFASMWINGYLDWSASGCTSWQVVMKCVDDQFLLLNGIGTSYLMVSVCTSLWFVNICWCLSNTPFVPFWIF
jgi:hypothetical protein